MKVVINGVEYPIAYTVEAQKMVADKVGGLDKIKDVIGSETLTNMDMIHIMMVAGDHRERALARMRGEEYEGTPIPAAEDLEALMLPRELAPAIKALSVAMKEGNKSEVEVKPEPKKKESATRSK